MPEPSSSEKRLLLVDGNSIINRSFFAMAGRSNLTAPDGTPTAALNTYLNTLSKFLQEVNPTHTCTLFDVREKTFRHKLYDGYKAKRKGMPDELAIQFPLLKEILDAMGLPRYELSGYEADDLIGTLAKKAEAEGFFVYILSGDKDDFQLIDDHTVVMMPVSKAGKTTTETYNAETLLARYEVDPTAFVTLKAIMGDPSDNIPGVKGIGEKGAVELVKRYGTLDAIYENITEFSPGISKKLAEEKDMAYLSLELSRIVCDVPITITLDDMIFHQPDRDKLAVVFSRLGFRNQIKKWGLENANLSGLQAQNASDDMSVLDTSPLLPTTLPEVVSGLSEDEFRSELKKCQDKFGDEFMISMDITDFSGDSSVSSEDLLIVSTSIEDVYSFPAFQTNQITRIASLYLDTNKEQAIVFHRMKNRFRGLPKPLALPACFDTEIAGYILNQIEGAYPSFEMLYEHATHDVYPSSASLSLEKKGKIQDRGAQMDFFAAESSEIDPDVRRSKLNESIWRALLCRRIAFSQKKMIEQMHLQRLVYGIEMPLAIHLGNMERKGVLVDDGVLDELHRVFDGELIRLSEQIYEKCGEKFNILSPKQLGTILFEKLGLSSGRKNGSGSFSTDSDELDRLRNDHPVVADVLQYRKMAKLDSTFVLGLKKVIDPSDGRVHSNFSQVMTSTGRLSSSEPNLQNIPIRSTAGSQIRKAFVAPDGYVLLDADYSQIELRLLAHLSGDENMTSAFLHNEDIHTKTASNIFHVPIEMVQPKMRSAAKTVNFSIVYGISDFGLSQDLGVSYKEAHDYIEHYYQQYPRIREYLESLKKFAYDNGYVETMFGRRRMMHELRSVNRNLKMFGERAAMNTPVQGTAADIIKLAMNRVSEELISAHLDAKLILQVHDELIIESKIEDADMASAILKKAMEDAVELSVPLVAEVSRGKNWFDCKS